MYDHQKDDEAEGNVDEIGVLEYSGSELKEPDGIITTDSNNDMIEMSAAENIINAIDVPTTEGGVMI